MSRLQQYLARASIVGLICALPQLVLAEHIKPLFQHELPNLPGKTLTVVEVDFAPNSKADAHRHGQAFVYAYVLSGTIRSQLAGEPPQTYHAGQGWFEPPGARHLLTENLSRTKTARLLVMFVANDGQSLKTPDDPKDKIAMPGNLALDSSQPTADATSALPQMMVNALYSAFGDHHSRAVHAKGIMAIGTFEPSAEAASLSKASIFANGTLPILVRFSDFTGVPEIPDTAGGANPRGFAVKFKLPDGSSADVISHSFNGFPTATTEEFRQLLLAIGASGPDAAKPTALDIFLGSHPIAKTFLTTQKPPPESYATLSYFGVNSFEFTDSKGHRELVRYRFVPVDGEAVLTPERVTAMGPNYLQAELPARLAKSPTAFTWYAQIAEPSDVIDDPSVAWPEARRLVKLGIIRVNQMAADPVSTDKETMFAPLNVPAGIQPADPMLEVRAAAYPLSFKHRQ